MSEAVAPLLGETVVDDGIGPPPHVIFTTKSIMFLSGLLCLTAIDLGLTCSLASPFPASQIYGNFKEESHDIALYSLVRCLVHVVALLITFFHFAPEARKRHLDSYMHEDESERYESKLPQLHDQLAKDPKREWERQRHAAQKRSNYQQGLLLSLTFLLDTFTSVHASVKTVEFEYSDDYHEEVRQAITFCSQVLFANIEFFVLKNVLSILQQERGRFIPNLHNHELFYAPKMPGHWCDGCHSRIVGEAYRCRLCDFDACPTCFDKAWRAHRNKKKQQGGITDEKPPPSNFDYFLRAMQQGRRHWVLFSISALALILSSVLSLALPSFTGQILDSVYKDDRDQFKESIRNMVIASAGISVLGIAQYASISIAARRIAASVRSELFKSILAQDIAFFDAQMSGQLTSRLTNDVAGMVAPWSTIFNTLTSSGLMLIGGFVMCLHTSWKLSALSFASVGPIVFLTSLYSKWSQQINREIYAALGDANSVATESLQNIRTVRAFSTEKAEIAKFSRAVDNALNKGTKDALASAGTSTLTGFVDLATSALILGFGGWTAMSDDSNLTAGKLLQFQLYYQMIDGSWKSLNGVINSLTRAAGAAQRVLGLMDSLPDIDLDSGLILTEEQASKPPELELKDVVFRYPTRPETVVLDEVNFVCVAGQTTALVGPSGGGKSTIISLLMRLYDVERGQVNFNGMDLRKLNIRSVHERIGLVQQDTQLFATSILDNISYGHDKPFTAQDVIEAAKKANIHEEIMRFEDGYSTKIGERGVRLSGGQRQRIALARCFLRKPTLLLLDEATSALDAQNEAMVQSSIDELLGVKGSTAVVVAHRLSTVKNAAKIVVVEKGKIVQEGTHESLLKESGGRYEALVRTQLIGQDTLSLVYHHLNPTNFVTCNQDEAVLIIGLLGTRVRVGRTSWKFASIEKVERLPLILYQISLHSEKVQTIHGVPINVTAIANVRVKTILQLAGVQHTLLVNGQEFERDQTPCDNHEINKRIKQVVDKRAILSAYQQFGGKTKSELEIILRNTIEGYQRQMLATLTVEEVFQDRTAFCVKVKEHLEDDLNRMGLELVTYTIQTISDVNEYMSSLGISQTTRVKREAIEGEARNFSEAKQKIAKAESEQAISLSQTHSKTHVFVNMQKELELEADMNLELKRIMKNKCVGVEQMKSQAGIELTIAIQQQHIIEMTKLQQLAELEVETNIAKQEGIRLYMEMEGKSHANYMSQIIQKELVINQADALANSIRIIGKAEAEAMKARGEAEAVSKKLQAKAFNTLGKPALAQSFISKLSEIAAEIGKPLEKSAIITFVS